MFNPASPDSGKHTEGERLAGGAARAHPPAIDRSPATIPETSETWAPDRSTDLPLAGARLHGGSPATFAVAHNHPSGDVTPSEEDQRVTAALARAADAVGVDFLTHVIVSADRWAACELPAGQPP